jgi:hypothetical protein
MERPAWAKGQVDRVIEAKPIAPRFPPDELSAFDAWIARQKEEISRPEAVRRLVAKALGGARTVKK